MRWRLRPMRCLALAWPMTALAWPMTARRPSGGSKSRLMASVMPRFWPEMMTFSLWVGRRVVAAAAAVGNDAGQVRADLRLDLRDHGRERAAVVRVARQRLQMRDELSAVRGGERCGDRHLDAEVVGPVRLALADAFDLGRGAANRLFARAGSGAGGATRKASDGGSAKTLRRPLSPLILRTMSRNTRPR